jgi:ArsR family transcriptional regulator
MVVDVVAQSRSQRVAELSRALADPVRAQVLELLRAADGEICQCHLHPHVSVSQPTLSHHLHKLTDCGLVDVRRRGRWAFYSVNDGALDVLRAWLA